MDYWGLFWTTGMPEAWLMSRDREGLAPSETDQGGGQGLLSPLAGLTTPPPGNVPGSPGNLY